MWDDNWIPRDEMMKPYGCRITDPPCLVSELIDATSARWNLQRLQEVFLPLDIPAIMNIPLCTSNVPDSWAWNFEKNGVYSVRSANNMLISIQWRREAWLEGRAGPYSMNRDIGSWKKLWNIQVPQKIRMFLWCLTKHSLPTNDARPHRKMATSTVCGLCGAADSWQHSLLDCTMSRRIWALDEELSEQLVTNTEPSGKQWLFTLMNSLPHATFVKLAVTLWATWSARRKAIHEGVFQSPHSTHVFICKFISELEIVQ